MTAETVKMPLYARAWDPILADRQLTAAEKLVLIQVCRWWPQHGCWETAASIARHLSLDDRYVRNVIKSLIRKGYLERRLTPIVSDGKTATCRVLIPLKLDVPAGPQQRAYTRADARIGERSARVGTRQSAPIEPPIRNKEKERKTEKSRPPAGGAHSPDHQTTTATATGTADRAEGQPQSTEQSKESKDSKEPANLPESDRAAAASPGFSRSPAGTRRGQEFTRLRDLVQATGEEHRQRRCEAQAEARRIGRDLEALRESQRCATG